MRAIGNVQLHGGTVHTRLLETTLCELASQFLPVSKPAPKCRQASQPAWFLKMTRNWVIRSIHKELRLKVDFGRHIPKSDQTSGKQSEVSKEGNRSKSIKPCGKVGQHYHEKADREHSRPCLGLLAGNFKQTALLLR